MMKIWGRNTRPTCRRRCGRSANSSSNMRAHRRRRRLRQEQGTGLSRDESERPGADARGRRRLPAVGIQFDRALSRRQARQKRRARAEGPKQRALASQWMDWQLSVLGPAISPAFWGLIRTPAEKRDMAAIKTSQEKTTARCKMLDAQLGKTDYVAGTASPTATFRSASCAIASCSWCRSARRCRISTAGTAQISKRKAFQDHVGSIPLT